MVESKVTKSNVGPMLLGTGMGFLAGILGSMGISKPAEAATPEEYQAYLAELMELMVESNLKIIELLTKINAAQGISGGTGTPGQPGEINITTPWVAREPVLIFDQAVRDVGPFQSDSMIDFRNGKRLYFKIESSLNQAVNLQLVSNMDDSFQLATNINGVIPCPANGNVHIGLAWDDWGPYVGITITGGIAPASGRLSIWAVLQE
jgi:hypothetical protein